jgi:acyl carrier protein
MTIDAILASLKTHAAEALDLPQDEVQAIAAETPIVEGLRLDSLRQVVLLTKIEEQFGFEFEPEELATLGPAATVGDLVRLIHRRAALAEQT